MEIIKTVQGWGTIRLEAVEERSPEVMRSVWEMVLRSSVGSWSRGRYQEVSESWLLAISNSFLQLICPILFPFYRHCPQTSSVQSHQCFVQLQHDIPYFILNSSAYQSMHQMPFSLPDWPVPLLSGSYGRVPQGPSLCTSTFLRSLSFTLRVLREFDFPKSMTSFYLDVFYLG